MLQAVRGIGTKARIQVPKTDRGTRTIILGDRLIGLLREVGKNEMITPQCPRILAWNRKHCF